MSALRADPPLLGNIENDAVRILELPLEVLLFGIVAEIEKELSAGRLDPFLRLLQIVNLEAEVMGADESARVLEPRPLSPLYLSSARLTTPSLR
jgi:hypothetical protein